MLRLIKNLLTLSWILIFSVFLQLGYGQISQSPIDKKNSVITQVRFEHLSIKNGLSGNVVWNILQDRKGYMWFGTLNGLSRYDGYKFANYQYRPHDTTSISQNVLFSLFEDSQGDIWVGSTEGGICKFDSKTEQFATYRPKQSKGLHVPAFRAVSAFNEDNEGNLWIGNFGGELRQFDKYAGKFLAQFDLSKEAKKSVGLNGINCIYKDHSGSLWVGSTLGLHRITLTPPKDGQPSRISFTHYLPDSGIQNSISGGITSVFEDHSGFLWLGTDGKGLNHFDPKSGKFTHYVNNPNDPFSLSNDAIWHQNITEDSEGNLWVGTSNGLNKLNPERTRFTRYLNDPIQPFSLENNTIGSLSFDRAGTLWIGTLEGISKMMATPKPFKSYAHNSYDANSLGTGPVNCIYEDKGGNIWIGNQSLSKFNKKEGTFTHFQSDNLPFGNINALLVDRQGTIWVAIGTKLTRFNPQTGRFNLSGVKQLDKEFQNGNQILSLYEDHEGELWIGSNNGVHQYDPATGVVQHYAHHPNNLNGIADYQAKVISGDRRGNIWIGHGSVGTTRFNKLTKKFTWFSHNPKDTTSISSNIVESFYEDTQGYFWVGTNGGGLCKFDHNTEKFTTYVAKQGLSAGTVYSILPDGKNNLWLGTDDGLFCFSLATHTFKRYDSYDGLQSNLFSKAALRGTDGTLYMGGPSGFNTFNPTQIYTNSYVPPIVITEFRLFDKPLLGKQEAKTIELNYDQNFFSFEFAALNYTNSHKNDYAYQLVGIDKEWVYSGTRRNVSYTDLPPGDYTFRIKAANNDGVWNEKGISVQVIIYPPWWRTWWAYTFYGLLFILGLWSLISYRSRALRRENRILEEKVHLRTNQLEQKSTELEKSLETLKSTQSQLIQKEKLASLGELTAGIAHEIQNPLNFVNNYSEVNVELIEEVKEELERGNLIEIKSIVYDLGENEAKIHHHGKRADAIVRGMLQHSRTNSGTKEPTNLNRLVDKYLRLAYESIKSKGKSFEVDYSTDFDESLPLIEVVPQDIGRALLNIVNNAFQAVAERKQMEPMGYQPKVIVITKRLPLLAGEGRGEVEIRIKDNGNGIPESIKDKIFQPFFTTKPTGQGTGLGLSLAYDIIKAHGGTIELEKRDTGTQFLITLPKN